MEENTYRPTYTIDDDVKNGWNPTQVRLYGLLPETEVEIVKTILTTLITTKPPESGKSDDGVKNLPVRIKGALKVSTEQGFALIAAGSADSTKPLSIGIIFGYAFEGQYYDLPKPKIMLIPTLPRDVTGDDSGYDKKKDYKVWALDKLEVCVEVEINQGFIEQVVLEANLPGRRSPSTYRAQARLAHRNGRLTE